MEISPLVLIFWGEVTFLMAGALVFIGVGSQVKKRRGRKYLSDMFATITSDRDNRKQQIREGLSAYGLEGDNLESRIAEIDKQERLLYKRIAHMYNKRSDVMLSNLPVAVEASTKPYLELNLTAMQSADASEGAGQPGVDPAEYKALQEQNEQLQGELSVTMETIGRMLSEYSSMFGSDDDADLDKSKIMEAFEAGEGEADEVAGSEDAMEDSGDVEDFDLVEQQEEIDVEDLDIDEGMPEAPQQPEPDVDQASEAEDALGEAVDAADDIDFDEVSVSDVDIDDILDDVAPDNSESEGEIEQAAAGEMPVDDLTADELSGDDIDALIDQEIPDDELLEIDDEPLLDSVDLGDDADDVLSDIVDLEENFGNEKAAAEAPGAAQTDSGDGDDVEDLGGDITDLDIDALLNENKK